jgi:hypothetical protein
MVSSGNKLITDGSGNDDVLLPNQIINELQHDNFVRERDTEACSN